MNVQTIQSINLNANWVPSFDAVFWRFAEKRPFVKKITIGFGDDQYLHQFIAICLYLIDNKNNIINQTKIRCIRFNFERFFNVSNSNSQTNGQLTFESEKETRHSIFGYNINSNDNNDDNDVKLKKRTNNNGMVFEYQIKDISSKEFGVLYKKLIVLFQRSIKNQIGEEVTNIVLEMDFTKC